MEDYTAYVRVAYLIGCLFLVGMGLRSNQRYAKMKKRMTKIDASAKKQKK